MFNNIIQEKILYIVVEFTILLLGSCDTLNSMQIVFWLQWQN